jgi:hypothetical protein
MSRFPDVGAVGSPTQQWMEADHGPVIKPRRQASGDKGQHPTTPRGDCSLIESSLPQHPASVSISTVQMTPGIDQP